MSSRRTICVITGSRAEYGLLRWLIRDIAASDTLQLQLVVTGMHLSPEFGQTIDEIRRDGWPIDDIVESQLSSDSSVGTVKSLGLGLIGFADAFRRLAPSAVVLLGDRYEILAAAQAAALMGIPVGHISGGEVTEGAVDDWIRHAITKASWWHFVAAEPYRRRVLQLGEASERVFNVGDPGLDSIRYLPLLERKALAAELDIALESPLFLVTYHPATLGQLRPEQAFAELTQALDTFPQATVVLTRPNADAGGRILIRQADEWAARRQGNTLCVTSLGQLRYLSLMRCADVVIGNSSSGIVEAPALKIATVNIGPRQDGRLKAASIIDCAEECQAIRQAIANACSPAFQVRLQKVESLYGDSDASRQIARILAQAELPKRLKKSFHDL